MRTWQTSCGIGLVTLGAACSSGSSPSTDEPKGGSPLVPSAEQDPLAQPSRDALIERLLAPAAKPPREYYDHFGEVLTKEAAAERVRMRGLDPTDPVSYQRIGAVHVTDALRHAGERMFFERKLGDAFGGHRVLGFGQGFGQIAGDVAKAIADLRGELTTNLTIELSHDLEIGSHLLPKGSRYPTGLDVERGASFPLGLTADGNITCGLCHATLNPETGERMMGAPNNDLDGAFFIALAPNSSAAFARLSFSPSNPAYQGAGREVIDSRGEVVRLPDPQKLEDAFDDALMDEPAGAFESSPDGINNTTNIPTVFTFGTFPFGFSGNFAVGPFAGLSAINSAVHSSEINMLAAAQISEDTLGIDREVYLGTLLQNAADPRLRLPPDATVKPSEWLRQVVPDVYGAELEDQVAAPGHGTYPNLKPSLFTTNGLVFTPNSDTGDVASGKFLFAANAMSAWQDDLVPPPNRTEENRRALASGAVERGAEVFARAQCAGCHAPPYFTDNVIHGLDQIGTNDARARGPVGLQKLFVKPKMYTLDTPVPPPPGAEVLEVPTEGISESPTTWPYGLLPKGGYRTLSLRGLYLSAPYLHDGGVAVKRGALTQQADGFYAVSDPRGLGLVGTLSVGIAPDPASSLRALLDRRLRSAVVGANLDSPPLVRSNLDGRGHAFYVDRDAGFSAQQQADLVSFLLALDDNPGAL